MSAGGNLSLHTHPHPKQVESDSTEHPQNLAFLWSEQFLIICPMESKRKQEKEQVFRRYVEFGTSWGFTGLWEIKKRYTVSGHDPANSPISISVFSKIARAQTPQTSKDRIWVDRWSKTRWNEAHLKRCHCPKTWGPDVSHRCSAYLMPLSTLSPLKYYLKQKTLIAWGCFCHWVKNKIFF